MISFCLTILQKPFPDDRKRTFPQRKKDKSVSGTITQPRFVIKFIKNKKFTPPYLVNYSKVSTFARQNL